LAIILVENLEAVRSEYAGTSSKPTSTRNSCIASGEELKEGMAEDDVKINSLS
jgi:hypothetical protein